MNRTYPNLLILLSAIAFLACRKSPASKIRVGKRVILNLTSGLKKFANPTCRLTTSPIVSTEYFIDCFLITITRNKWNHARDLWADVIATSGGFNSVCSNSLSIHSASAPQLKSATFLLRTIPNIRA